VHRSEPDPAAVFSPDQWTEIAKAISLDGIPSKEKQAICDAFFAYDFARLDNKRATDETSGKSTRRRVDPRAKGRAALSNFIKYARGLRVALLSVENYLKTEDLIIKAAELTEGIYEFQRLAKHELDEKSLGGRPGQHMRDDLVCRLAVIYERLTGKKPTRSVDRNGRVRGPFLRFCYTIFQAQAIAVIGLPNSIAKAVRYAKNRH
jgi:hypothetical protein